MMTMKEEGRRSREEGRHGGCAERKGRTLAQQERRSGRMAEWANAPSVRHPVRALPGKRRDWLQRQDSNLRHRGYEPRGMTAPLRCGKTGAPSFCGLRNTVGMHRSIANSKICLVDRGNFETSEEDYDGPVPIRYSALNPLVDRVLRERLRATLTGVGDNLRAACQADNICHSECCSLAHTHTVNGFKIQFQDKRNPKRKIIPAL